MTTLPADIRTVAAALAGQPMLDALAAPGPPGRDQAAALAWLISLAEGYGAFAWLSAAHNPQVVLWSRLDDDALTFVLTWYACDGTRRASDTLHYRDVVPYQPDVADEQHAVLYERVLRRLRAAIGALDVPMPPDEAGAAARLADYLEQCADEGLDPHAVLAAALRRRPLQP